MGNKDGRLEMTVDWTKMVAVKVVKSRRRIYLKILPTGVPDEFDMSCTFKREAKVMTMC